VPTDFQHDVFLSHNSKDKPRVRKLAERLRAAGLRVWFDEWIIKPGDDIYLAVKRGLEETRVLVLCLSPAALGSDWVTLELSTALFRDPTNVGRRFVQLLLADCKIPDALRLYKYVDFRSEAETAFEELLASCRINPNEQGREPKSETNGWLGSRVEGEPGGHSKPPPWGGGSGRNLNSINAWLPTNQDQPLMKPEALNREDPRYAAAEQILNEHYRDVIEGDYEIRIVPEPECGSENFCVVPEPPGEMKLLRLYKRVHEADNIRRLQIIETGMAEAKIFPRFGHCLKPAAPGNPFEPGAQFVRSQVAGRPIFAALYPFASGASRFEPTENQFKSLAYSFGRVQNILQGKSWDELSRGGGWIEIDLGSFPGFSEQVRNIDPWHFDGRRETLEVLQEALPWLESVHQDCATFYADLLVRRREQGAALHHHDVHPNNAFFFEGQCALIYDFEFASRSVTEEECLAFTLHRFGRRLVAADRSARSDKSARQTLIRRIVKSFVEAYRQGHESCKLDDAHLFQSLHHLIKITNLLKILYVGKAAFFREHDRATRRADVLHDELVKSIRCVNEAQAFEFLDAGFSPRRLNLEGAILPARTFL
jgi:hypothetical protein